MYLVLRIYKVMHVVDDCPNCLLRLFFGKQKLPFWIQWNPTLQIVDSGSVDEPKSYFLINPSQNVNLGADPKPGLDPDLSLQDIYTTPRHHQIQKESVYRL